MVSFIWGDGRQTQSDVSERSQSERKARPAAREAEGPPDEMPEPRTQHRLSTQQQNQSADIEARAHLHLHACVS